MIHTKELRAMQVREIELRDSLGKAHEEDRGLNAQAVVLNCKSEKLAREVDEVKAVWALERK